MKFAMMIILALLASSSFSTAVVAQNPQSAFDAVQNLKLQLIELDGRQEATKLKEQQLEEALKPENIERALAGIGSTRPEELREERRRQLLAQKKIVDSELEQLTLKRTQLEASLATAEAQAYQESAGGGSGVENQLRIISVTPRLLVACGLLLALIVAVVICLAVLLRMQSVERALR